MKKVINWLKTNIWNNSLLIGTALLFFGICFTLQFMELWNHVPRTSFSVSFRLILQFLISIFYLYIGIRNIAISIIVKYLKMKLEVTQGD